MKPLAVSVHKIKHRQNASLSYFPSLNQVPFRWCDQVALLEETPCLHYPPWQQRVHSNFCLFLPSQAENFFVIDFFSRYHSVQDAANHKTLYCDCYLLCILPGRDH